jgi:hypothetical protein
MKRRKLVKAAGTGTGRKGRQKIVKWSSGIAFGSPSAERDEAIAFIVEATGKEPDSRGRLARDIFLTSAAFHISDLTRQTKTGEPAKRIKRVQKNIQKLEALVSKYPQVKEAIGTSLNFQEALMALDLLVNPRLKLGDKIVGTEDRQPSPIEWLAGCFLPVIFEERFGSPATFSRVDDIPHGPVIYFIETVLLAHGRRYSRNLIGTAISRFRKTPHQREAWREALRGLGKNRKN